MLVVAVLTRFLVRSLAWFGVLESGGGVAAGDPVGFFAAGAG